MRPAAQIAPAAFPLVPTVENVLVNRKRQTPKVFRPLKFHDMLHLLLIRLTF